MFRLAPYTLALALMASQADAFSSPCLRVGAAGRTAPASGIASLRCAGDAGDAGAQSRRNFFGTVSTAAAVGAASLWQPLPANATAAGPKLPDEWWQEKVPAYTASHVIREGFQILTESLENSPRKSQPTFEPCSLDCIRIRNRNIKFGEAPDHFHA